MSDHVLPTSGVTAAAPSISEQPDRTTMLAHLEFIAGPAREKDPDLRVEIACAEPNRGPNFARTYALKELPKAVEFAAGVNARGRNVYVGATLKRADTPAEGRTKAEHACLSTAIPVDLDSGLKIGAEKLKAILKPHLLVLTGQLPEPRGQIWIATFPNDDMETWTKVHRLAVDFCYGDQSALGSARLMRLAGTVNYPSEQKKSRGYRVEPTIARFRTKIVAYELAELRELLTSPADLPVQLSTNTIEVQPRSQGGGHPADPVVSKNARSQPSVEEMGDMLRHLVAINYFEQREQWVKFGMALKPVYGDQVGFQLWAITHVDDRARNDAPAQWSSFASVTRPGDVTIATIIKAAQETGFHYQTLPTLTASAEEDSHTSGDVKNGRRLAREFRNELIHIHETGEWLVFDTRQGWTAAPPGEADRAAKKVVGDLREEAAERFRAAKGNDQTVKELMRHIVRSSDAPRIRAMIELAKSEPGMTVRLSEFDSNPMLLGISNGVLDLRTRRLRPVSPEVLVSKRCAVAFDATAECPRFKRFMSEVQPDEDVRNFLQRLVGLCLTGLVAEHFFAFLFGHGANGKSVFVELVAWMLGDYARKIQTEMLMHHQRNPQGPSPDIVSLKGMRFVYANETVEGRRLDEARIKELTGGDKLSGRFPYGKENIHFDPTHKLFMVGNHKPEITDTSFGMWRRVGLIQFEQTIPEGKRDPNLLESLKGEGSGVLNWALAGLHEYQKGGLRIPSQIAAATAEYRDEQDLIADWIRENCLSGPGCSEDKAKLYQDYKQWAEVNGHRPFAQARLTRRLNERGYRVAKDKRTVQGISLKSGWRGQTNI